MYSTDSFTTIAAIFITQLTADFAHFAITVIAQFKHKVWTKMVV